eukprot:13228165-Alexandrium_andersonii.AAC.1
MRLLAVLESDRRPDGRTDGRTARQTEARALRKCCGQRCAVMIPMSAAALARNVHARTRHAAAGVAPACR